MLLPSVNLNAITHVFYVFVYFYIFCGALFLEMFQLVYLKCLPGTGCSAVYRSQAPSQIIFISFLFSSGGCIGHQQLANGAAPSLPTLPANPAAPAAAAGSSPVPCIYAAELPASRGAATTNRWPTAATTAPAYVPAAERPTRLQFQCCEFPLKH